MRSPKPSPKSLFPTLRHFRLETLRPDGEIFLADASHPVATQTRQLEGWEAFQSVKFPRRIINFHGGKRLADIREINASFTGKNVTGSSVISVL